MAGIPQGLFDGQVLVDAFRVKWVYNAHTNTWERQGKIDAIPTADGTNIGLLPKNFKTMLDRIVEKGGGFAIITPPLLSRRAANNPDGVLFGNVELVSDTLAINCVGGSGINFTQVKPCERNCFTEGDKLPPGFDLSLSDTFWASLCGVNVPGGPGNPGPQGDKGNDGALGTGDGPVGIKGEPGRDAPYRLPINGVKIIDTDDLFDTAVVKMELDGPNGLLYVTKAKTTNSDAVVANQAVAKQISRSIKFTDCWNYEIIMDPCVSGDDFDVLDPLIAFLPEHFVAGNCDKEVRGYQPVRARFSTLVDSIIGIYKNKLQSEADRLDQEIADFIKGKDDSARGILDELGDRMAECENVSYLEYCVGIGPPCNIPSSSSGGGGGESSSSSGGGGSSSSSGSGGACSTDPEALEVARFVGCPSGCVTALGDRTLSLIPLDSAPPGAEGPVYSFTMPDPANYPSQNSPGMCGSNSQDYVNQLVAALNGGTVVHKMVQIMRDVNTWTFQPGTYVIVYKTGGFFQYPLRDMLALAPNTCASETLGGIHAADLAQGGFRKCYVGNEGNGGSALLSIFNGCNQSYVDVSAPLVSSAVGVDVGIAPLGFTNPIPGDYFTPFVPSSDPNVFSTYPTKHGVVSNFEVGVVRCFTCSDPNCSDGNCLPLPTPTTYGFPAGFYPNPRIDFVGLSPAQKTSLGQISWHPFPATPSNSSYSSQPQLTCLQKWCGNSTDNFLRNFCRITVTNDQVRAQLSALQSAYYEGDVGTRALRITVTQPSTVWLRCKLAYNVPNALGQLIMPQSKRNDQYATAIPCVNCIGGDYLYKSWNGYHQWITKRGSRQTPCLNAQPVGFGSTTFKVYQVDCGGQVA